LNIEVALRSQLGVGTSFSLRVTACQPVAQNTTSSQATPPAGRVHCIGSSEDLLACIKLVSDWNYLVTGDDGDEAERPPENTLGNADLFHHPERRWRRDEKMLKV